MTEKKDVRAPFRMDAALLERLRRAAYWTPGSLRSISERAIEREIKKLETAHREGRPFKPVPKSKGGN